MNEQKTKKTERGTHLDDQQRKLQLNHIELVIVNRNVQDFTHIIRLKD